MLAAVTAQAVLIVVVMYSPAILLACAVVWFMRRAGSAASTQNHHKSRSASDGLADDPPTKLTRYPKAKANSTRPSVVELTGLAQKGSS